MHRESQTMTSLRTSTRLQTKQAASQMEPVGSQPKPDAGAPAISKSRGSTQTTKLATISMPPTPEVSTRQVLPKPESASVAAPSQAGTRHASAADMRMLQDNEQFVVNGAQNPTNSSAAGRVMTRHALSKAQVAPGANPQAAVRQPSQQPTMDVVVTSKKRSATSADEYDGQPQKKVAVEPAVRSTRRQNLGPAGLQHAASQSAARTNAVVAGTFALTAAEQAQLSGGNTPSEGSLPDTDAVLTLSKRAPGRSSRKGVPVRASFM